MLTIIPQNQYAVLTIINLYRVVKLEFFKTGDRFAITDY